MGAVSGSPNGTPNGTVDAGGNSGGAPGDFGNNTGGQTGAAPVDAAVIPRCVNLQCQQRTCDDGDSTTISGTVFDPAGNNPLYNVAVYVPNAAVEALPTGATCETCDSLYTGTPIAAALTDAAGKFVLEDAPDGTDIPLVVQIGKWRRQFTIPSVAPCQDNPQPQDLLRLPRNRNEGDIPKIAISTGMADTLECLLLRIGLDASEFASGPDGEGRIHIFQGSPVTDQGVLTTLKNRYGNAYAAAPNTAPAAPTSSAALWNATTSLMGYDIVLLSCEGQETSAMNQQALHEYANAGGRLFASHFHYSWFNTGPFGDQNLATWSAGSNELGDIRGTIVTTLPNGDPFPKGQALSDWLGNVGALQNGLLPIEEARHNADVSPAHTASQPWILADDSSSAPGATQYFSFNTPVMGADAAPDAMYCGRVVYSDLHVGAASGDNPIMPVPDECAMRALSPQEAALEFMLFDLSSCLTPDDRPPEPPIVE